MCGIAGFVNENEKSRTLTFVNGRAESDMDVLKKMCDSIAHRGPDEAGYFVNGKYALGNRRLSIIDLQEGNQPIHNENKNIWLTFNGEIYNYRVLRKDLIAKGHRFYTGTDTETLVHLYEEKGVDFIKEIEGMFAFGLLDLENERLVLGTDRAGKKPIYFSWQNGSFVFGSEVKSVLKHSSVEKALDEEALQKYLVYGYIPAPLTIFRRINKIPPSSVLIFENNQIVTKRYWDYKFEVDSSIKESKCINELDRLIESAVKKRLMSDVPVGLFLSGGVDSSLILAYLNKINPDLSLETFTICYDDKITDEARFAKKVASCFDCKNHAQYLDATTAFNTINKITDFLDEPIADPSIIPTYIVSKFAGSRVKVVLSGDGSDEIFGGYPKYTTAKIAGFLHSLPNRSKLTLSSLIKSQPFFVNKKQRYSKFIEGTLFPDDLRAQALISPFFPKELPGILSQEFDALSVFELYSEAQDFSSELKNASPLNKMLIMDARLNLNNNYLVKLDRASMACSLEVRSPFLDMEIMKFAAGLPDRYKVNGFQTKSLLKKLAANYLPNDIVYRSKRGFGMPLYNWSFEKKYKDFFIDVLLGSTNGFFDKKTIELILTDHFLKKQDNQAKIWPLLIFNLWFDKWLK